MGAVRFSLEKRIYQCPNCQVKVKGIINLTEHIHRYHLNDAMILYDMLHQLSIPNDVSLFVEYLYKQLEANDER